jgi:hypothetical protein
LSPSAIGCRLLPSFQQLPAPPALVYDSRSRHNRIIDPNSSPNHSPPAGDTVSEWTTRRAVNSCGCFSIVASHCAHIVGKESLLLASRPRAWRPRGLSRDRAWTIRTSRLLCLSLSHLASSGFIRHHMAPIHPASCLECLECLSRVRQTVSNVSRVIISSELPSFPPLHDLFSWPLLTCCSLRIIASSTSADGLISRRPKTPLLYPPPVAPGATTSALSPPSPRRLPPPPPPTSRASPSSRRPYRIFPAVARHLTTSAMR